jgi:hypothetical protein
MMEVESEIEPLYTDLQSMAARVPKLLKTPISQFFQWCTVQSLVRPFPEKIPVFLCTVVPKLHHSPRQYEGTADMG